MKAQERIAALRARGYHVAVRTRRPIEYEGEPGSAEVPDQLLADRNRLERVRESRPDARFGSRGGVTTVTITDPSRPHEILGRGESRCSWEDNWVRETGLAKAVGRAISALGWDPTAVRPGEIEAVPGALTA